MKKLFLILFVTCTETGLQKTLHVAGYIRVYQNYEDAVTITKFYDSRFNQQSIILEVKGPNTNIYTPGYMDFVPTYSVQQQHLSLLKVYRIR
jgi:hypothetical protein